MPDLITIYDFCINNDIRIYPSEASQPLRQLWMPIQIKLELRLLAYRKTMVSNSKTPWAFFISILISPTAPTFGYENGTSEDQSKSQLNEYHTRYGA